MAYPIFTKFFCCCSLKRFGRLFGWIYTGAITVFGLLCFLAIIGYLINANLDWNEKYGEDLNILHYVFINEKLFIVYIMIMATYLLYAFMGIISGVLLVYGVKEVSIEFRNFHTFFTFFF